MQHRDVPVRVGCASWVLRKEHQPLFSADGSHLQRYSQQYTAVEINSSFYGPHDRKVYERWAGTVPSNFLFSVKLPKVMTHEHKLGSLEVLPMFLGQIRGLKKKLGPILVQLPPSLGFTKQVAETFFSGFRKSYEGSIVCEPRHVSWFETEANDLLKSYKVARVATDPAIHSEASQPGGWQGLRYYRLHGSPKTYFSAYEDPFLEALAETIDPNVETWVVFDNTAAGEATVNSLDFQRMVTKVAAVA